MPCMADYLRCPVCLHIPPGTKYFICSNGHSICELCRDKLSQHSVSCPQCGMSVPCSVRICPLCKNTLSRFKFTCPQCRCKYPHPEIRNLMAEQMIANDPELEVSCRSAVNGCPFSGRQSSRRKHEERVCRYFQAECPLPSCTTELLAKEIEEHMEKTHDFIKGELTDLTFTIDTIFKSNSLNSDLTWKLGIATLKDVKFYICRKFCAERASLLFYVIVNLSPELARKYKLDFKLGKGQDCYLHWTGHAFSTMESKDSLWKSVDCLSIGRCLLNKMWTAEGISPELLDQGWTHRLESTITIHCPGPDCVLQD